jgi:hypothetical protein
VAGWVSPLGALPPAPDGPLITPVTCRTGSRGRGARHDVTLDSDWSLSTPHDLEAERVLAAFGGTVSCIALHDVVVPALHDLVQVSARRHLPRLRRTGAHRWTVAGPTCRRCADRAFRTVADAARHVRSVQHHAGATGADARALGRLYDAVGRAHAGTSRTRPRTHPLVREVGGVAELWDAGVPPQLVDDVHHQVWPDGPALPVALYLSSAYLLPDLSWLAAVARRRPDPDVLTWAAWTECDLDRHRPEARLQWLAMGLSVRDVQRLMAAGCTAADAQEHADLTGRTLRTSAGMLAAWHAADCVPGPGDLAALHEAAPDAWTVPSGGAIDLLERDVQGLMPRPTRTQVGLVLAVAGTRAIALGLLRRGVRDPHAAARFLDPPLLSPAATPRPPSRTRPTTQHEERP